MNSMAQKLLLNKDASDTLVSWSSVKHLMEQGISFSEFIQHYMNDHEGEHGKV
jgi:hypothetical protein